MPPRLAFGIPGLDGLIGGGLLPGTLTVIAGATGAGKTQLGLRWAHEGASAEGRAGVICDLTSRGDAQNHRGYAEDFLSWSLAAFDERLDPASVFDPGAVFDPYWHPFRRAGRRVTRQDLAPDDWHAWRTDLARVLKQAAVFFYGQFVRGCRRVVVDGIEPTERFADSIQFEFFEYLYHQLIRQQDDWVARELLRERFRALRDQVEARRYDTRQIGCIYLYTTPHVMLDELVAQPLTEGDIFANANTILLLGRTREEGRMGRALFVAKHRGSGCDDRIVPYRLTDRGPVVAAP
ncbi:MAG: ATPase domain-containing protein [Isosphaeraceae bacterium]